MCRVSAETAKCFLASSAKLVGLMLASPVSACAPSLPFIIAENEVKIFLLSNCEFDKTRLLILSFWGFRKL